MWSYLLIGLEATFVWVYVRPPLHSMGVCEAGRLHLLILPHRPIHKCLQVSEATLGMLYIYICICVCICVCICICILSNKCPQYYCPNVYLQHIHKTDRKKNKVSPWIQPYEAADLPKARSHVFHTGGWGNPGPITCCIRATGARGSRAAAPAAISPLAHNSCHPTQFLPPKLPPTLAHPKVQTTTGEQRTDFLLRKFANCDLDGP